MNPPTTSQNPYSVQRFRRALHHFVLGRGVQAIAAFALVLLVIRLLPPLEYGAYVLLVGLVELCRPLASLGLVHAVQQFLPELAVKGTRRGLREFVYLTTAACLMLMLALAAGLYLLWAPLTALFDLQAVSSPHWALMVGLLLFATLGAEFAEEALDALLEQRFAQAIRAFYPVARLVGLGALAYADAVTLLAVIWLDIGIAALCFIAAELVLLRKLRAIRPSGEREVPWRDIALFCWHLTGADLISASGNPGALRLVAAYALGPVTAGHFAFLQQLLSQFARALPAVQLVGLVRPMLITARLRDDTERLRAANSLMHKSNVLLLLPLVIVAGAAGGAVLSSLSGGRIDQASVALLLVALTALAQTWHRITAVILQVHRLSALTRRNSLFAPTAPAFVLAGAAHSLEGALLGLTMAALLRSAAATWSLGRAVPGLTVDLRGLLGIVGVGVAALVAGWLLALHAPVASVVAALAFFAIGVLWLRPLAAAEAELIASVAPRLAGTCQRLTRRPPCPR